MFVSVPLVDAQKLLTSVEQKGPMDILTQTIRKEGFFALYKGLEWNSYRFYKQ